MIADNLSEEKKRDEIATELDLNMFVEAGAGAGKTTLIVSRIVKLLSSGVEPGKIVVITFTNAAAEELRGRIIDKVQEAAKEDPALSDKLHRLNDMNISTIHSFCNVLLHEQGLTAGLPLEIELLQDEDERKEKKKYFDEFLQTLTENDWDELEKNSGKENNRFRIRSDMEELYLQMADLPADTEIVIPDEKGDKEINEAMDALETLLMGDPANNKPSLAEKILSALNASVNPEKKDAGFTEATSYQEAQDKYCAKDKYPYSHDFVDVCNQGHSVETENECYKKLLGSKENKFISKTNFKTIIDKDGRLQVENKGLNDYVNSILTDDMRLLIPDVTNDDLVDENGNAISYRDAVLAAVDKCNHGPLLARHAKKAREYYREHARNNRFSNDRLLELTRDLILNDDKIALKYFSEKYTHFFVDEFQDTDRIQESFIYRLASDPDDESKLRDGALFVVGDPKQSIYRFRGAQPAVYFSTKDKMAALDNAKVYELSNNFRSNEDVINWVNDKFAASDSIMPIVDEVGIVCPYQKMTPVKKAANEDNVIHGIYHMGRPDAEHSIGNVTRHLKSGDKLCEGFIYNESSQGDDIKAVVDLIKDLTKKDEKGKGYFQISDYKKDENDNWITVPRDIEIRDFLLISHNKGKMDDYVKEMKRYGIPVVLDGKEDLRADRGLVVFVRLYQYLVNPRDSFYRTGAEEALRETLHIKGEEELHTVSEGILDCMYDDTRSMSAYGMAEYLERQVSVLFDKETTISRVDALSTQTHIRQMVEFVCRNVTGTGIEVAEAMQDYLDAGLEHELSLDENPDAVRFMNLHKTKGLEGNIVIMLDRRGKNDRSPVYHSEGNKFYPGIKTWTSLSDYPDIKKNASKQESAEFHRLEYVAVTRAGQAVIFMNVIKKNGLFAKKKGKTKIDKDELDDKYKDWPAIYWKMDDSTFSYEIENDKNIREKIDGIFKKRNVDKSIIENKPYHAETAAAYDPARDDYPEASSSETPATAGLVRRESPSGLEKKGSKKHTFQERARKSGKSEKDEKSSVLPRPIGNIAGDMLHRSMELLISRRFAGSDISIEDSCTQAVNENSSMVERIKPEGITEDQIKAFMIACAKSYNSYMDTLWSDVKNVYPEVSFSYGDQKNGETVWMNGTADLIMEMNDGTFRLIDYKSDNDYLLTEAEMEEVLSDKYSPQLAVYRGVIQKMLGVSDDRIKTGIISFSQKDEAGSLLPDGEVRVRYTELKARQY